MFRKLISHLPFSPALVHDVDFYARRLRKEEATRRLTVLFVVLAVVIQSLAVFSPPESANASSEQDVIRGGVSSKDDFLWRYDRNEDDIKDILTSVGITRAEIAALQQDTIATKGTYFLTRYGQLSSNEVRLSYERSTGGLGVRFFTPLDAIKASTGSLQGWAGTSKHAGWFAITKANGSLAVKTPPVAAGLPSNVTKSVSAVNLTKNTINAANTPAQAHDRIVYTLQIRNTSTTSQTAPFSAWLGDILEYAALVDAGGATFDTQTSTLSWPQVQLSPGQTQQRTFVVQLLGQLPSAPTGQSNPASYDCAMNLAFGDDSRVPIDCPTAKGIEGALLQLPTVGPGANILFAVSIIAVSVYFYARTRQLKKEIRIIRHNLITGIM